MSDWFNDDGTFNIHLEKVKPPKHSYEKIEYQVRTNYVKSPSRMNKEKKYVD